MKSPEEYYKESILEAQKSANKNGLEIGSVVAHPDDEFTYMLSEIRGETAIVKIPAEFSETGKEIIKEFPLKELFNPKTAMVFAQIKGAANK